DAQPVPDVDVHAVRAYKTRATCNQSFHRVRVVRSQFVRCQSLTPERTHSSTGAGRRKTFSDRVVPRPFASLRAGSSLVILSAAKNLCILFKVNFARNRTP